MKFEGNLYWNWLLLLLLFQDRLDSVLTTHTYQNDSGNSGVEPQGELQGEPIWNHFKKYSPLYCNDVRHNLDRDGKFDHRKVGQLNTNYESCRLAGRYMVALSIQITGGRQLDLYELYVHIKRPLRLIWFIFDMTENSLLAVENPSFVPLVADSSITYILNVAFQYSRYYRPTKEILHHHCTRCLLNSANNFSTQSRQRRKRSLRRETERSYTVVQREADMKPFMKNLHPNILVQLSRELKENLVETNEAVTNVEVTVFGEVKFSTLDMCAKGYFDRCTEHSHCSDGPRSSRCGSKCNDMVCTEKGTSCVQPYYNVEARCTRTPIPRSEPRIQSSVGVGTLFFLLAFYITGILLIFTTIGYMKKTDPDKWIHKWKTPEIDQHHEDEDSEEEQAKAIRRATSERLQLKQQQQELLERLKRVSTPFTSHLRRNMTLQLSTEGEDDYYSL